eukprot:6837092-Prymnesium_polylepis.1
MRSLEPSSNALAWWKQKNVSSETEVGSPAPSRDAAEAPEGVEAAAVAVAAAEAAAEAAEASGTALVALGMKSVSYTHLTLPTICSV